MRTFSFFLLMYFLVACGPDLKSEIDNNIPDLNKLYSLHSLLPEALPGDWRFEHPETDQTYKEYKQKQSRKYSDTINTIYICLIGDFSKKDHIMIDELKSFMNLFYALNIQITDTLDASILPDKAKRYHLGSEQWNSKYILYDILEPRLPADALAYIALTSNDLFPNDKWNFVFGQASPTHKVGVASSYWFKTNTNSESAFNFTLKRILRTAIHETNHIFGLKHCSKFSCLMNGSNSLAEADKKPLWLCPICLAKLCWFTQNNLQEQFDSIAIFIKNHQYNTEYQYYNNAIKILSD